MSDVTELTNIIPEPELNVLPAPVPELNIISYPAGDWIYNIKFEDAVRRKEELKAFVFGPPRATPKRTSAHLSADNYIGVYFNRV
jgi:hypothetical protein